MTEENTGKNGNVLFKGNRADRQAEPTAAWLMLTAVSISQAGAEAETCKRLSGFAANMTTQRESLNIS